MAPLRNPVALFLATGLLSLGVIVVGTAELSRRAAADEAVQDALSTTDLLAGSVAEPAISRGLVDGDAGAIDRFDRAVLDRLRVPGVRRIKIWASDGTIVYSDETQLIGDVYPLGASERRVLAQDTDDAEVSDLSRPENRYERGEGGLVEVYTRIDSPEGDPLLFEAYFSAAALESREDAIFGQFAPITLAALGMVVLVATGLLWAQTRRVRRAGEERERLLRSAVDASAAERVRIARDLHDGVVQDLAGAQFSVAALARSAEVPGGVADTLEQTSESMRASLRSLRSLMVEIYPPDLRSRGLASALDDLLAPAAAAGITATVSVEGAADAGDAATALVWRVAQEAVRNAIRHSRAHTLDVRVTVEAGHLLLSVVDDGRGFDPGRPPGASHFGLRGLAGLVEEAGGRLEVRSRPGEGTRVDLSVGVDTGPDPARPRRWQW